MKIIKLERQPMYSYKDKTVLITGGTGSFGRAATRALLQKHLCEKVIIFSRDEWKQWEMKNSDPIFGHSNIRYFLGDVRDKERLNRALNGVQVVIHAAALKQVPAAEYNPTEFVKTNIQGAMNVIDSAIQNSVERVIALSTDKAVNPINLYGATKLCSDKLFIAAKSYVGKTKRPLFSLVRYGNVLGSRGSLIPFWKQLIAEGVTTLPVTDKRMTRFWITIEHAVQFVLDKLKDMNGAEIYIPKIPSVKIVDIAKAMAPNLAVEFLGIREGEKLHELLVSADESRFTLEYDDSYLILPSQFNSDFQKRLKHIKHPGVPVKDGFTYTSQNNPDWLMERALKKLIKDL